MAWKRQYTHTSIDVDLDEFSNEELLQGLINARWISEEEAEAIALRAKKNDLSERVLAGTPDSDALYEAHWELHRGRIYEAKVHLERFLGHDWLGVLAHG